MRDLIAIVLGGGRGSRLEPLTGIRAKPAVPLAGKYRLIDIPLSNCINSDINRIYVLTQFMSVSLHTHIRQTYTFDPFRGGFVELLAATERPRAASQDEEDSDEPVTDWFQGTADAVRKCLDYLMADGIEYVLILSGDQLYRMDYREMIETHRNSGADVTIAALPVTREAARSLGVMRVDQTGRVEGFLEKPQKDEEIDLVKMDPEWIDAQGIDSQGRDCLASMGIYLFNRQALVDALTKTDYTDFGKEVFPAAARSRHVQVHLFDDYWEDIGTIRSFFDANLMLASEHPQFSFYRSDAPVYSRARFLPPTMMNGAQVSSSLIADGCRIGRNTVIENSVIGLRSIVGDNVTISNSIVMGADEWYGDPTQVSPGEASSIKMGIGDNSVIRGSIIDKNCCIGEGVVIENSGGLVDSYEYAPCIVRDGIPILVKNSVLSDGWRLPG